MEEKKKPRTDATTPLTPASGVPTNRVDVVAEGGETSSQVLLAATGERQNLLEQLSYTAHVNKRCAERGINLKWIQMALAFGRKVFDNGAIKYLFGRRELRKHSQIPSDLLPPNGLVVVCSHDHTAVTAYVDPKFGCLKRKDGRNWRRGSRATSSLLGEEV